MSITIYSNGLIFINYVDSGLIVTQTLTGTRVTNRATGELVALPSLRYSLACDNPATGVAGRSQFDADLLSALSGIITN